MFRPTGTHRAGRVLAGVALFAGCASSGGDAAVPGVPTTATSTVAEDEVFTEGDGRGVVPAPTVSTTEPPATTESTTTSATTTSAPSTSAPTTSAPTTTLAPATTAPAVITPGGSSPCPPTGARVWDVHPASDIPVPDLPEGWRVESAGTSVQGRDLTVWVRPVDAPARTVVVIGGIHGNEPVSPPAVRAMVGADIPADTEVWLLPLMNPDGSAIGTRCNANGVDLNRNFSWGWRADTGGPAAFSEPEPTAAAALVERVAPDVVVWVHQPLGYVSSIGATPDSYEQAWAIAAGVPVRPDVTQHGGGESWTAFVAGYPSMLIEVSTYLATPEMVASHVAGFAALLEVVVPR